MKFSFRAFGRQRGAIGIWYWLCDTIESDTWENAENLFRSRYECRYVERLDTSS